MSKDGQNVLLTNSRGKKRGPKEVHAGNVYGFAHQAYWGFRFLSEKRKPQWRKVLLAKSVREIQDVGKTCSQRGVMTGAGYGATGLMTWLRRRKVALRVLEAKNHRRYPTSERPSSHDRRMIFLGIAVAAGIWEMELSTALRKLAEAGLGIEHIAQEVHRSDRFEEYLRKHSHVFAEPVDNYFSRLPNGKWYVIAELPCRVPPNCHGGFIIHGYDSNGSPQSTFSWTLPTELLDTKPPSQKESAVGETLVSDQQRQVPVPRHRRPQPR